MSYKNLGLKIWNSPTETRVYINTKYVDHRDIWSGADGAYLYEYSDGDIGWKPGFKQGPWNTSRSEMQHMAMEEFMKTFIGKMLFFELIVRINECLTKSGNFSMSQYEKKYN